MASSRKFDPGALAEFTGQGVRELARRLGLDPAVLCRPISAWQADRYAVRLGVHPHSVWGDAWWVHLEEVPEEWLADGVDPDDPDREWIEALGRFEARLAIETMAAVRAARAARALVPA